MAENEKKKKKKSEFDLSFEIQWALQEVDRAEKAYEAAKRRLEAARQEMQEWIRAEVEARVQAEIAGIKEVPDVS